MTRVDYSKWDHIEVSDDEDDTHPNIDTPSLFRWRHQARLERDAAWKKEKAEFEGKYKVFLQKYNELKKRLNEAQQANSADLPELLAEKAKLDVEDREWHEKEEEMKKKERLRPWNIDTICHEGKSKTIINSATLKHEESATSEASEEAAINRLKDFVKKHNKTIRKFGMFQKPLDSQNFLLEHPFLVCEETANQLVLWCIDLAMEEKYDLMNHVSHQCIVMQFMLELAKSLKCDPRACVRPFFAKFMNPEPEYQKAFDDELSAFRDRIRARAKVRIEEAMMKLEEEEREKRLGPGGLDPVEVFDTLPPALQECFEKKDVEMLKTVLCGMDPKDAEYHMKRCVDSGLWVDNVNKEEDGEEEGKGTAESPAQPGQPTEGDVASQQFSDPIV
ncbi:hsp90 co-chaperone Cdc37 [Clonorchis sinensis]|uniref:Hsp90 chaperone protein kinase-targeting subunit n=3 Tax=Opisthorchiidae TaxID=6196 RepID=G7YL79_CLOSI|nr:hsp90 co-chaperone Cdc37 [Clonorchis sinensis]GAA53710.1 cell division cycle protein 37 [Clonorchis sinensis]